MLIPVRCVTCGKVLADKYRKFQERVSEQKGGEQKPASESPQDGIVGTSAAAILTEMGLTKMCCRRHMLTNVDAMDRI
jgi:DNA-directed RNA polymerase subunit N (RpoN/RPB10)